jgi:hypothetical protein
MEINRSYASIEEMERRQANMCGALVALYVVVTTSVLKP